MICSFHACSMVVLMACINFRVLKSSLEIKSFKSFKSFILDIKSFILTIKAFRECSAKNIAVFLQGSSAFLKVFFHLFHVKS
jgi:hypothetical protein